MGNAVRAACENLIQELVEAASEVKGGDPSGWQVMGGELRSGGNGYSFAEIVSALPGGAQLTATGQYTRTRSGDTSFGGHDHWAPSAAAAEVEVDCETGEVRVLRYAIAADAGRALHRNSAKGQIEGGAVMGFGLALFEEVAYDEGQLLNADAFQYRLPLMRDIPNILSSSMVENGDGPGPFGAKGLAQVGIPGPAPAIGNAIYDAIGVRLRSTPFTPEKVLRALRGGDRRVEPTAAG
ncbi:MAG: aldehyde oxidase [Chloroflexi bacterium]|nr:aldehyde oxidase [Chloroflexota bacterium]